MSDAPSLTRALAEFVSDLQREQLPPEAVATIQRGFTDCIGVAIAARNDPAPQQLKRVLAPPPGDATLLFGTETAPAPDAAWINGTAAHAYDFDDVALKGHPSAVLVPAILAEAQSLGSSGESMVLAYAAGYEVWGELVSRDQEKHQRKGWHPTGIFGSIAAAAACARLRGLDAGITAMALSLGASQSGGLIANFGTHTKPFHAGRAAHAGVLSARLASAGFTASPDALEHEPGFLHAVSPGGLVDTLSPARAGTRWKLIEDGLDFKKYPLCFAVHTFLDGLFDLVEAHGFVADEVERVDTFIRRRHSIVLRYDAPQTALQAKFSMPFAVACALIAGRVGLPQLDPAFIRRDDVQQLMRRVHMMPDEREAVPPPPEPLHDHVCVTLKNGARLDSGPIYKTRGSHDRPLRDEELWTKFEACVEAGAFESPARPLFDALMHLADVPSVHDLPGFGHSRSGRG